MKFYGNAQKVAEALIAAFEAGQVAEPLAASWLDFADKPMSKWSTNNRFFVHLMGCTDARGYQQWQEVGRQVRKGEKAHAWILVPLFHKVEDEDTGDEQKILYGFKGIPVFDVSQTEGEPLDEPDHSDFLATRPLAEVAQSWGIELAAEDTAAGGAFGYYSPGQGKIALGVENLSTWLHELVHAADRRLGNLTKAEYNRPHSEAVAELGGAILAHLIGEPEGADEGGAWQYIRFQAGRQETEPINLCWQVLNRTVAAVEEILQAAELAGPVPA